MKKSSYLFAALLLSLSLTACGGSDAPKDNADNTKHEVNQTVAATEASYEPGVWKDDVYTNESLGFSMKLPEGWSYGTSEDIDQVQQQGAEITGTSEEDLAQAQANSNYDLYIYNDTGASMMMMAEDVSVFGDAFTEKEYLKLISDQLTGLADDTLNYNVSEPEALKLGNTEFLAIAAEADYSGVTVNQIYAAYAMNGKMISVIISAPEGPAGDECVALIESITPIN